jgi:euchromatic histone-lysine N-methyltransferase
MPAGFPQMSQGNGSQSHGPPGTDGSSRQCARLKKVQIGAVAPVHGKKRVSKGAADRHEQMPKSKIPSISNKAAIASLQEFRLIYNSFKFLFQDQPTYRPDDYEALWVFRDRYSVKNYDGRRLVGRVPGIKVGDVFDSDAELHLTGLHRSRDSHVDYIVSKQEGRTKTYQAVSVVSSYGQHSHDQSNNNLDHLLLHVGSVAGQLGGIEELALKQTSTSVRVIYRFVADHQAGGSQELTTCYVYAGLYLVERKDHGIVDAFQLTRVPGQPRIDIQELAKERIAQPSSSNGTFMADMSSGLEENPVSAINLVSNEHPTSFLYISRIRYHDSNDRPDPPSGCDCVGPCSDSQDCVCAVKNGGKINFDDDGGIIDEKPLLYECGPSCKCPPTCHNRVSQHRIKFRLQVFKTDLMGWGVRSLDFIRGGSFVCEYLGELLDNKDAQKRENDEYLFVTGDNYFDVPRWEESLKTIPSLQNRRGGDEAKVFAVDALESGNLARFINHSCNPNLFTQNVLYDHDDVRMPHIMLFACGDIRPLQPLSLDYNYAIGKVHDSQGNIKKKKCFCRSSGCKGRLY